MRPRRFEKNAVRAILDILINDAAEHPAKQKKERHHTREQKSPNKIGFHMHIVHLSDADLLEELQVGRNVETVNLPSVFLERLLPGHYQETHVPFNRPAEHLRDADLLPMGIALDFVIHAKCCMSTEWRACCLATRVCMFTKNAPATT